MVVTIKRWHLMSNANVLNICSLVAYLGNIQNIIIRFHLGSVMILFYLRGTVSELRMLADFCYHKEAFFWLLCTYGLLHEPFVGSNFSQCILNKLLHKIEQLVRFSQAGHPIQMFSKLQNAYKHNSQIRRLNNKSIILLNFKHEPNEQ